MLTLKKGAEGSTLKVTDENAKIAVKNKTNKAVKVETPEGTISIGKGKELKKDTTKTTPLPLRNRLRYLLLQQHLLQAAVAVAPAAPQALRPPYDAKGRLIAKFGTPKIDGTVDSIWNNVVPVTVKDTNGKNRYYSRF
jgi:hypothetical protein